MSVVINPEKTIDDQKNKIPKMRHFRDASRPGDFTLCGMNKPGAEWKRGRRDIDCVVCWEIWDSSGRVYSPFGARR